MTGGGQEGAGGACMFSIRGNQASLTAFLGGCKIWTKLMNGVYLDFQKAFHKVSHKRLF